MTSNCPSNSPNSVIFCTLIMVESRTRNLHIIPPRDPTRYKILVIGESSTGKTSLVSSYTASYRPDPTPTIGVDLFKKDLGFTSLSFWDLSGHPEFFEVRNEFYKDCHSIILVYDITSRRSFDALDMWLREANRHGAANVSLCLCGNKTDLENKRTVSKSDAESWAFSRKFDFFEVSAKTGLNIQEMMSTLISKLT